jgi:hypothetical protein
VGGHGGEEGGGDGQRIMRVSTVGIKYIINECTVVLISQRIIIVELILYYLYKFANVHFYTYLRNM